MVQAALARNDGASVPGDDIAGRICRDGQR